jgi:hypothetical protein
LRDEKDILDTLPDAPSFEQQAEHIRELRSYVRNLRNTIFEQNKLIYDLYKEREFARGNF